MDNFMRGILSRVLTEEIENQLKWQEMDRERGLVENRDDTIARIEKFMAENDIPKYFKCW